MWFSMEESAAARKGCPHRLRWHAGSRPPHQEGVASARLCAQFVDHIKREPEDILARCDRCAGVAGGRLFHRGCASVHRNRGGATTAFVDADDTDDAKAKT